MNIFIICPVRLGEETSIGKYIADLEIAGHTVHYPPRDTNQVDDTGGYRICFDNLNGIINADEVHIWYRGDSQGIHFDLGMAFALGKRIKILNLATMYEHMPESYDRNAPKSYPKMIEYWEANNG